jgi:hypothetical protein
VASHAALQCPSSKPIVQPKSKLKLILFEKRPKHLSDSGLLPLFGWIPNKESTMEMDFVDAQTPQFDARNYIRMLVAIVRSDKDNGPREMAYIEKQARHLGVDLDDVMGTTDKNYAIAKQSISRLTALMILRDAIRLASLDRNFSLPERQRIYGYAEKMDIARKDVDALESLTKESRVLFERWRQLVASV